MKTMLSLCVHGEMLPAFLQNNKVTLTALADKHTTELVIYGESKPLPELTISHRFISVGKMDYNQSLMALMRQATGEYAMLVDAVDHLQPDNITTAIRLLKSSANKIACAGGINSIAGDFMNDLSPAGILMRRSAACRFLRVTEYGLLSGWFALAQLARTGKIIIRREALSKKVRVPHSCFKPFDILNRFLDSKRTERYLGFLYLYDYVTIEHYLSDSEQFLLFWPEYSNKKASWRTGRMFRKRGQLYDIAARQAADDNRMAIALHYSARSQLAESCQQRVQKKTSIYQLLRNLTASSTPELTYKPAVKDIQKAVAEQLNLFITLMGNDTRLFLEDCNELRLLKPYLADNKASYISIKELQLKTPSANELVLFYNQEDVEKRLQHFPATLPGRQLSYTQLMQLVAGALPQDYEAATA